MHLKLSIHLLKPSKERRHAALALELLATEDLTALTLTLLATGTTGTIQISALCSADVTEAFASKGSVTTTGFVVVAIGGDDPSEVVESDGGVDPSEVVESVEISEDVTEAFASKGSVTTTGGVVESTEESDER